MPRLARIAFPHTPHHVYQRGHRQQPVFFCKADRDDYLATLAECRETLGLRLYAYCLMDNHIHLIIDPGIRGSHLSATMKRLAGRHARRMNARHGWHGSLWESRFKCSPIESERYLLTCGRYIDLNPVRARMVQRPEHFAWSSYRSRAGLTTSEMLDCDPALDALASLRERRHEIYRELCRASPSASELKFLREALHANRPTGSDEFTEQLQTIGQVRIPNRNRGRPPKRHPETKQAPCGACLRDK
jgi:putative transposase